MWPLAFVLFLLQGLVTPLLAPWPVPDLLLLVALLPLGRVRLWQALSLAYFLGALQDVAGGGVLGLHALGLAGGVFVAGLLLPHGTVLLRAGLGWQGVSLAAACAGKWLVFAVLLSYLDVAYSVSGMLRTGGLELLLTLASLLLLHPLLNRLAYSQKRLSYS